MRESLLPRGRDEWIFAAAGLMLVAAQLVLIATTRGLTHLNATTYTAVAPLLLGLAVPTVALLIAAPRLIATPPSRLVWVGLIAVGALLRLVWLGVVPPLDDDFFRYLWDGAMVAHGHDPYTRAPRDFLDGQTGTTAQRALAAGATQILESVNFNEMRTIYPSVAQAAFALAHVLAPFKVDGLRLVFLCGEIATFVLLVRLLRDLGASPLWSLTYWWNPFAATMTIGLVHVDALIPPLVLGALLLGSRGRTNGALVLLGLGAGIKIWPVLLAPMLLWPLIRDPRRLMTACLVLGATLLVAVGPVLMSTLRPGSGLSAYAAGWTNNNAFYAWTLVGLKGVLGQGDWIERSLRMGLVLATGVVALVQGVRGEPTLESLSRRALIVAASVFYLAPAQFPWYATWFLPLAALRGSWPLLLASAVLPSYFLFFPLWPMERGSLFFYAIAFIHSVPVLGWLLYERYSAADQTASIRRRQSP